jgi:aminoglycoside phosphotransferase (APT) family kinase protein
LGEVPAIPHFDLPIGLKEIPSSFHKHIGTIQSVSVPKQGATSDVLVLHCNEGHFVIKRCYGKRFSKWLSHEYETLRTLSNTIIPVPTVYDFFMDVNQAWLLMSHIEGISLRDFMANSPSTRARCSILMHYGKLLSILHSSQYPPDLTPDKDWLLLQLQLAEYNLIHYEVNGPPELLKVLQSELPKPIKTAFIHGDCSIDNVIVFNERVVGLLDWGLSAYGDPRYDLAMATRPKPNVFQLEDDAICFFAGYGEERITEQEERYFVDLFRFL